MEKRDINKMVCDWSLSFGVALTAQALDALVDRIDEQCVHVRKVLDVPPKRERHVICEFRGGDCIICGAEE